MTERLNDELRPCGDCMLCCKVMAIKELDKPCDKWCQHAARGLETVHKGADGLVQIGGCKIYDERPDVCRGFNCLWKLGVLPEEYKPNKIHAVVWASDENPPVVVVSIDKSFPGVQKSEPVKTLIETMASGYKTLVAEGSKRRLIVHSMDELPDDIRAKIESKMREGVSK